MAFVNIDDTNPLFNYKDSAWSVGGITGEFQSTHHSTSTAGAQVIFGPFTGSSISVYCTVGASQPKIHFQVDGGSQNVDLPAISESNVHLQSQLYSASNLDPTQHHTLQINVLDVGPFTLDFVQIGTTGSGVTTTSISPLTVTTPAFTTSTTTASFIPPVTPRPTNTPTTVTTNTLTTVTIGSTGSTFTLTSTATPTLNSSNPFRTPSTTPLQTTPPDQNTETPATGPTMSSDPSTSPLSPSSSPSPTGTPAAALGEAGTNVDGAVIGSVTGAIIFLALVVVGLVLYLRRRRFQQRRPAHTKEFGDDWLSTHPKSRRRLPSLRLNLSGPASSQKVVSPFLPTHISNPSGNANASSVPPVPPQLSPPSHSFLEQDPADSPVFDIKERPISGATMATRVTVGTNVSQRASVPEYVYEYPFREPAVPGPALVGLVSGRSAQAAPTFTLPPLKDFSNLAYSPSSMTGTVSPGETWPDATSFGFVSRNPTASSASSYYSPAQTYPTPRSPSVREAWPAPTSVTPTDAVAQSFAPDEKAVGSHHAANLSSSGGRAVMEYRRMDPTYGPTSFDQSVEEVLHQDAGITLESSLGQRRIDLPPHYSTIGFHQ